MTATPFPQSTPPTFKKRYDDFIVGRLGYWIWLITVGTLGYLLSEIPNATEIAVVLAIIQLTFTAARCRDAGLNGWWCLTTVIPLVAIYFGCIRNDDHPKKLRAIEKLRVHKEI